VGRIGGDEFDRAPAGRLRAEAQSVVDRISAELDGGGCVSIGVAWSTGDELDADAVARADFDVPRRARRRQRHRLAA
jgi:hypothetical protein